MIFFIENTFLFPYNILHELHVFFCFKTRYNQKNMLVLCKILFFTSNATFDFEKDKYKNLLIQINQTRFESVNTTITQAKLNDDKTDHRRLKNHPLFTAKVLQKILQTKNLEPSTTTHVRRSPFYLEGETRPSNNLKGSFRNDIRTHTYVEVIIPGQTTSPFRTKH